MVQGQTGTLSLDVRSSVDKGVSKDGTVGFTGVFWCIKAERSPSFLSLQRRVMFLTNDYFYTVINETPFRFVPEKQIFLMCHTSRKTIMFSLFLIVWVLFWLEEMDSIYSLETSLLRRVSLLSILVSFLFRPQVWTTFLSLSGLHDLLGSDLTIASEWSVLPLNTQCYHMFVLGKRSKVYICVQDLLRDRHWPSTSEAESAAGRGAIPHRQRTRHEM